jgi:hypothetical protein
VAGRQVWFIDPNREDHARTPAPKSAQLAERGQLNVTRIHILPPIRGIIGTPESNLVLPGIAAHEEVASGDENSLHLSYPDLLDSALVQLERGTSTYDANNPDLLAASRTSQASTQGLIDHAYEIILDLVQETLDQPSFSTFEVLEEQLTTLTFHLDDTAFGHICYNSPFQQLPLADLCVERLDNPISGDQDACASASACGR